MEQEDIISLVLAEIGQLKVDVKTEVLLALSLEKGLQPENFTTVNDGIFVREHSRDLLSSEIAEDARYQQYLQVHLSRSGIYDQLPEGLFFDETERKTPGSSAADMVADYTLNKKREAEIRKFFQPIDNDFFWQRIQLEQEESRLLEGLQSGILNDYFIRFWQLPRVIPKAYLAKLILLLPYAHKITGDMELTAESLEHLLLEQVDIVRSNSAGTAVPGEMIVGLGESKLGVEMLCGEYFSEECPVFEFVIGPLERTKVSDYLQGGKLAELLETFGRFFVPAGVEIKFTITLPEPQLNMVMTPGDEPVLGYTSVL